MALFKIPLANTPQIFDIQLNNVSYTVTCYYNTMLSSWLIDMQYSDTGVYLFASLPLVTGVDLLAQYEYLGIGGKLIVYTDGDRKAIPTLDNLGIDSNLYFETS